MSICALNFRVYVRTNPLLQLLFYSSFSSTMGGPLGACISLSDGQWGRGPASCAVCKRAMVLPVHGIKNRKNFRRLTMEFFHSSPRSVQRHRKEARGWKRELGRGRTGGRRCAVGQEGQLVCLSKNTKTNSGMKGRFLFVHCGPYVKLAIRSYGAQCIAVTLWRNRGRA